MAMSVLVRSMRREGIRRRRQGFAGRGQDNGVDYRANGAVEQPTAAATTPRPAGRRRELGPAQDQATYSCSCGYVFEASVSTSVGCPHCGTAQAW
jgi:hypothetical protein